MNRQQPKIFLYIAVISLLVIAGIVGAGTMKGRYSFFLKKGQGALVLGITDKLPNGKLLTDNIQNYFENAVSLSKSEISKKVASSEGQIRSNLEKEVADLTAQQIKSMKLKICQDWGIVKE